MASICCNFAAIAYLLHCSVLTAQCSSWSSMHLGPISASLWQLLFTPCFSWRHFPSLVLIFLLQKPCCSHKYWKGLKKGENKWGGFIFAFCESPEPTLERCCKICFTSYRHFLPNGGIDSFQSVKGFHVSHILIFLTSKPPYWACGLDDGNLFCVEEG